MSSEKTSPFEEIARRLLDMSPDDSDTDGEPGEITAIAIEIAAPHDVRASNIPDLHRRFDWEAGRDRGTTHATIRRSTKDVVVLWRNEPPNADHELWIEIASPNAGVRPAWFKLGRGSEDGSAKSLTIPNSRLGFDPLSHDIRVRVTTG